MKILLLFIILLPLTSTGKESICYGTTSNGRLENGVKLPSSGKNYESYSLIANTIGRIYVHSAVKMIIVDSYKALEKELPDKIYKYAETGSEYGGQFKPHKTHRNGLSVDFMVPVKNKKGESVHLPTNALNKWGYNIEFNAQSQFEDYTIDYESMAAHIVMLHKIAIEKGYDLWRVIFAPELQSKLFETQHGEYLKKNIQFSKKRSWVRHDEHYHVDFDIPCKTMKSPS